ncbi:MBL fold metallo-hydrolase [Mycolicibacterium fortuitum]|uniref:MBL fold metallo-hydrolase n=1 Tax=Mycolicibacterium fortuitum TaxID=1766 RepID=UPI0007E9A2DC|nr:MBL fold metallo-hydrolase [Mycolicibacterium fortuitum]MCA4722498.1 MBL fold metallo-hydrolase [Mycolicibacterium fortuitum]OBG52770.1 MBL fold metallo-hydrolase [Mycolicibacterium fortuitum]
MEITVTFVGNATTLIAAEGVTLLTDPNFLHLGQHAYLGYGLVSKRLRPPALTVEQLPPVDAVLLSHMHGDHWDRVTQRKLDRELPILTTPHAAKRLLRRGFGHATGMSTWQSHRIVKGGLTVTVTSIPGRHAPTPVDRLLPPVMGSMIEFTDGAVTRRLYVSGDTLFVDELREIPLPAGSKLPFGLTVTMDAGQGADLVELLDLPKMIPVHFDDYSVFASSLNDFRAEMARRGLGDRVIELDRGASVAY